MKTLFLFRISILIFLAACNTGSENKKIKEFIPGTYFRYSAHEYGTENDTLTISLQNHSSNEYEIIRKWEYKRILDGKAIEPQYKRLITTATYNRETKMLEEIGTGASYSFYTQKKALFAATAKYVKLR